MARIPLEQARLREVGLHAEFEELSRRQQREGLFERGQREKAVAQEAMAARDVRIWLEFQEQERQAEALREQEEFQRMFARTELERKLSEAFDQSIAREHLKLIEGEIRNHPQTRKFLQSSPVNADGRRVFVHPEAVKWALWAAGHRQKLLERLMKAGDKAA
ncbi:hypothetical protein HY572_07000 [Candidatus Micrarchaeota archaeon]|nr:hypothetical protein [Candidatus Micrarchaeota archaeon]